MNYVTTLLDGISERGALISAKSGEQLAGRALRESIAGLAAAFQRAGVGPGDLVLLVCDLSPASLVAYLSVLCCGGVAVPVASTGVDQARASLPVKAIWRANATRDPEDLPAIVGLVSKPGPDSVYPRAPEDLAALMPTSGSTGQPQFVQVTHENLLANNTAIVETQGLGPTDKVYLMLPLSYCFGLGAALTHLQAGGAVVLDRRGFLVPKKSIAVMAETECTSLPGVPTIFRSLRSSGFLDGVALPHLRRFLQAGGALDVPTIQYFRETYPEVDFFVMYGQTEATSRITTLPPNRLEGKLGSVGLPLPNIEVRIGPGGDGATPGVGEIQVRGPSVTAGFWPDGRTADRFEGEWLRTGDLGHSDEDGFVWISGRIGDFAKVRGRRINLSDVESVVRAIPGAADCAAMACPSDEAGEAIQILVEIEMTAASKDVTRRVEDIIQPEWKPCSVTVVDRLPRTASGKVAKQRLSVG